MKGLKLLFMGTPDFALPSLERLHRSRHRLQAVVTQPDRPSGRKKALRPPPVKVWALQHQLPVLQPTGLKEETFMRQVEQLSPDLIVIVAYGRILPPELLRLPRLGTINLHASLLPAYRGAAPIERAVIEGCSETGVTVMEVVQQLDAGDIILQERLPLHLADTAGEVAERLASVGSQLLVQAVDEIALGKARRAPQDCARVTYAPPLCREEECLDWSEDALSLYNRIRGLNPCPGAYTICRGRRLKIWRAAPPADGTAAVNSGEETFLPADAPPGTVLVRRGSIFVAAGKKSFLELLEVQPAGKKPISAGDFCRGYRLATGEKLGE